MATAMSLSRWRSVMAGGRASVRLQGNDKKRQEQLLITYTENELTNSIDEADDYRTPLPCEARTYELIKVVPDNNQPDVTNLFGFDEMLAKCGPGRRRQPRIAI